MTSGPKRPWFRFHLLTAVLMMIAAGSLVGTNMRDRGDGTHGWPCCMHYPLIFLDSEEATIEIGEKVRGEEPLFPRWYGPWNVRGAIINTFLGLMGLLFVALVSEFLIRRREGRKP